jgi:hypothetical protein
MTAPAPGQSQGTPSFNDGFTWKDENEAYATLEEAWNNGDKETYQKADMAIWHRNFQAVIPHVVQPLVKELQELRSIVQEIAPDYREKKAIAQATEASTHAARTLVYDAAGKIRAGMDQFLNMWDAPKDGATVILGGVAQPATPINTILAKHSWIGDIQDSDPNPIARERKTFAKRFMAAYQIFRNQQVTPLTNSAAAQIFDAGKQASSEARLRTTQPTRPAAPSSMPQPASPSSDLAGLLGNMGVRV